MKQTTKYVFILILFALIVFEEAKAKMNNKQGIPIESNTLNGSEAVSSEYITNNTEASTTSDIMIETIETTAQATTAALLSAKYTEQDILLIEKIVQSEVGNCSEASKIAVSNIILNRLSNNEFPNTIQEVVFEKRQFSTVNNMSVVPSENTKEAVMKALNGEDNSQGALFFYAPKYVKNKKTIQWFENRKFLFELDGQRYFK